MYCKYYTNIIILSTQYICYYRKPILPIEKQLVFNEDMDCRSDDNEIDDIGGYIKKMMKLKKSLFSKANTNIKGLLAGQKRDYDKKHHQKKVGALSTTGMNIAININVVSSFMHISHSETEL